VKLDSDWYTFHSCFAKVSYDVRFLKIKELGLCSDDFDYRSTKDLTHELYVSLRVMFNLVAEESFSNSLRKLPRRKAV